MALLQPGLHLGVGHNVYHSDPSERPSLSSHVASIVVGKSAGHAAKKHPRFGGQPTKRTDATDTGTLLHDFLLGGGADFVEVAHDDWRTKDARERRDEARARGAVPVLSEKLDTLRAAAEKVRPLLLNLSPNGLSLAKTEVTAIWTSKEGCPCRCRIDDLEPNLWIWDLKFCEDAMVSSADHNIASMGHHVQAASNIDAVESLIEGAAGRVHFGLCFVEWENPEIGIVRKEVRGQLLDVGQRRWKRAKGIWARCLAENRWPGYSTEIVEAQCPPWIAAEELERQVNNAGPPAF